MSVIGSEGEKRNDRQVESKGRRISKEREVLREKRNVTRRNDSKGAIKDKGDQ
jgi:hypothetical protein